MIRSSFFYTVEDIFAKNDEERRLYELREKGRRICESAIRKAKLDGEASGEARAKRQVARSMLLDGMSAGTISKVTGLSIEEINDLSSQSKNSGK
ncbi:MAG: hypothetical protein LBL73_11290 [Synergistaceae bacterium]|nr:hypothetical protein [Synergistaceae bacterium]